MHRILLCDSQEFVRSAFRLLLDSEPDLRVVAEESDGRRLARAAQRAAADVIVTELDLPPLCGLEVLRVLRRQPADVPAVVVLTGAISTPDVVGGLRAGAQGIFVKSDPPCEVLHGIRTVRAGRPALGTNVLHSLVPAVTREMHGTAPPMHDVFAVLTARERHVLRLVAEGLSNREVGRLMGVSDATVKSHVSHLLQKLGLRDRVQAVALAYRFGLAQAAPGPPEGRGGLRSVSG